MMHRIRPAALALFVAAWSLLATAVAQDGGPVPTDPVPTDPVATDPVATDPVPVNPVAIELQVYVVSQVTRDDGTREERFTQATEARPGQVVEYRLVVRNVGDETLPAGIVVVTGPVPEGTQFVAFSATPSDEGLLTEFSADRGTTFYETNVFVGQGEQRRIAEPDTYDAVRWTLLEEFEPAQELTLVYRVTVR